MGNMQQLVRNKRGLQSDKQLLDTVTNHPGLSQYELTKQLNWPSGKVDGTIRRLTNQNQLQIKTTQRNGRQVNLIYAKDSKPHDLIEIPVSILQIDNQTWTDIAHIYALDSTTIGIAGQQIPEWTANSCFSDTTPIKKDKETIALQMPERFSRFYNLQNRPRVVTVNGNPILITITGNLINRKKYPA
jgi:hypothetical protein